MTRSKTRRGFTLFEMVLAIAGAGVILSTGAALLTALLRLDRGGREHLNDTAAVARLVRQFRQDVREAEAAEPFKTGLRITTTGGPTVTYDVKGDRLVRVETLATKLVRQESFPAARLGPVSFDADGPFVRLTLLRRPADPGKVLRPAVRVDARLGKHRALAGITGAKS